eukprot:1896975-Prymnesium_polylepis.1
MGVAHPSPTRQAGERRPPGAASSGVRCPPRGGHVAIWGARAWTGARLLEKGDDLRLVHHPRLVLAKRDDAIIRR